MGDGSSASGIRCRRSLVLAGSVMLIGLSAQSRVIFHSDAYVSISSLFVSGEMLMRRSYLATYLSVVILLAGTCCLSAQESKRPESRDRGASGRSANRANSAMSMLQRQFEQRSPALGSQLPDVSVFDDEGKPLHVRDLRGKYTVIVFGCLT